MLTSNGWQRWRPGHWHLFVNGRDAACIVPQHDTKGKRGYYVALTAASNKWAFVYSVARAKRIAEELIAAQW